MKKILSSSTIIACVFLYAKGQQNTWTQKNNFGNNERNTASAFSIGTKGYICAGLNFSNAYKNDLWEYDSGNDSWTQKSDFGTSSSTRNGAVGFSIGTKGYLCMGENMVAGMLYNDLWEYNPSSGSWTQQANFPGNTRVRAVGFSIGNYGYVGTGNDGAGNLLSEFWQYNPSSNTWTAKTNFGGSAREGAIGFSIEGFGYIGTGNDGSGNSLKDFWQYNPSTDSWWKAADFGGDARSKAIGFSIGTKGFIGTGYNQNTNSYFSDFWMYDPYVNSWSQMTDLPGAARASAAGFAIGNKGYIGTGSNNGPFYLKDFWQYDAGTLAVDEQHNKYSVSVFPNPTSGKFQIQLVRQKDGLSQSGATDNWQLASSQKQEASIEIYNVLGEKIFSTMQPCLPDRQAYNHASIDISSHPNGIYFLFVKSDEGTGVKKLILNK